MIVWSLQADAGPGANPGGEERFLSAAGREQRDVRRGDYVELDLLELGWQREGRLWPPWRIGRIVLGPSINPDRVFADHDVGAISLDRFSECCQRLLKLRLGLGRRAIDQAGGLLCNPMLESRAFSQRDCSGSEPSSEIDERKRKENGRHIKEQAKSLSRGFRGRVRSRELCARLLQRFFGLNGEQPLESVVD